MKKKFFALVSVLSCLPPLTPTFCNMTPRSSKSSGKRCSGGIRRSNGFWSNWKKQQSYVGLSTWLRRLGGKLRRKLRGRELWRRRSVKIVDGKLYFIFPFHFYFTLLYFFLFNFLFLEQLGLGFISHTVTSVTNWWHSHKTDHETWEKKIEGFRTKWHHTAWTTHAGLMLYSWPFRVGCTVASMDHEE